MKIKKKNQFQCCQISETLNIFLTLEIKNKQVEISKCQNPNQENSFQRNDKISNNVALLPDEKQIRDIFPYNFSKIIGHTKTC